MASVKEQLQSMRSVPENWDGYEGSAPQASVIDFAEEFVGLIESMLERSYLTCSVHVSPTRFGGALIEWENGVLEHEVEIASDQSISFLHHNKSTGQIETRKFSAGATIVPPGFLHELRQLLARGDRVKMTIAASQPAFNQNPYPLRGTPIRYDLPTEPVAEGDWEATRGLHQLKDQP